MMDNHYKKMFY